MRKTKTNRRRKGFAASDVKSVRCRYCSSAVHLRSADGIYKDNSSNAKLYVCTGYPVCDSYVRVHPGTTTPVGTLANPALRALRTAAHRKFDKLHESGLMSKKEAYAWLAHILQCPMSQAHIGYLNEYYCSLIIEESGKLFDNLKLKLAGKTQLDQITGGEYFASQ